MQIPDVKAMLYKLWLRPHKQDLGELLCLSL